LLQPCDIYSVWTRIHVVCLISKTRVIWLPHQHIELMDGFGFTVFKARIYDASNSFSFVTSGLVCIREIIGKGRIVPLPAPNPNTL